MVQNQLLTRSGLEVGFFIPMNHAQPFAQLVLGYALHTNQQATAVPVTAGPTVCVVVKQAPTTKIDIADAKIGPVRNIQRLLESRQQ